MKIGEKLRFYRKKLGLTLQALKEKTGIAGPSISDYENDKVVPRKETLERLAKALEIKVNDLFDVKEDITKEYPGIKDFFDIYANHFIRVSILGQVHAGNPNEIPEDLIIGDVDLPISIAKGADYALRVTGMSMKEEGINENDIVLVRLQKYAENGQICIARIDSEKYVIKRFRQKDGRTWLESANSIYEPITDNFEIVGIITSLVKKFI